VSERVLGPSNSKMLYMNESCFIYMYNYVRFVITTRLKDQRKRAGLDVGDMVICDTTFSP